VDRDDVVIIGIACPGLVDLDKVERLVGKERDELGDIQVEGDKVVVKFDGERREFSRSEVLYDSCLGCKNPTPREYDILLGEERPSPIDTAVSRQGIEALEQMPLEERWGFWKGEFSRCIRCYACRNVCPACFCERCFVDISLPQWVSPLPKWQDNLIFQLTRMLHVAGRCVDCGACERACPVGIPLRSLAEKMNEIVEELFEYQAGMDKDASPLLAAYELTDPEDFIR
jgi:ferredoxin